MIVQPIKIIVFLFAFFIRLIDIWVFAWRVTKSSIRWLSEKRKLLLLLSFLFNNFCLFGSTLEQTLNFLSEPKLLTDISRLPWPDTYPFKKRLRTDPTNSKIIFALTAISSFVNNYWLISSCRWKNGLTRKYLFSWMYFSP